MDNATAINCVRWRNPYLDYAYRLKKKTTVVVSEILGRMARISGFTQLRRAPYVLSGRVKTANSIRS